MIKVIALDFDGVIMDSVHEVFVLCQRIMEKRGEHIDDSAEEEIRHGRNLVKTAMDLYTVIEFYKRGIDFDSITQDEFDDFARKHKEESKEFYRDFFTARKQMQDEDFDEWFSLNNIFPGVKDVLKRLSEEFRIAIISTKDFHSINTILERIKVNIDKDNIISKEFSETKSDHIMKLSEKFSVRPDEIFFIDDMPKNLEDTRKLGVNVALAGWGYNNDEQKQETRQKGIPVLNKPEDIEKEIKRLAQEKN